MLPNVCFFKIIGYGANCTQVEEDGCKFKTKLLKSCMINSFYKKNMSQMLQIQCNVITINYFLNGFCCNDTYKVIF